MSELRSRLAIGALGLALACTASAPAEPSPTIESKRGAPSGPAAKPVAACPDLSLLEVASLPALPESPYASTLQEVWQRVLEKHYDRTLGCVDWPALRLSYAQKLVGVDDRGLAYAVINDMLAELGQSHFRLFAPGGRSEGDERIGPASPPMHVRWIEERMVVTRSTAKGKLGAIKPGSTLLAVDDRPFEAAIADARANTHRP
ncbi:MAG: hypothetical protein IAG13_23760, partial [Deltaproteobacteria bacterium]|nr:hypothetical protein [Nannocystaceae bacterium]